MFDTLVYLLDEGVYAIGYMSAGEMLCRYYIEGIEYECSFDEGDYTLIGNLEQTQ